MHLEGQFSAQTVSGKWASSQCVTWHTFFFSIAEIKLWIQLWESIFWNDIGKTRKTQGITQKDTTQRKQDSQHLVEFTTADSGWSWTNWSLCVCVCEKRYWQSKCVCLVWCILQCCQHQTKHRRTTYIETVRALLFSNYGVRTSPELFAVELIPQSWVYLLSSVHAMRQNLKMHTQKWKTQLNRYLKDTIVCDVYQGSQVANGCIKLTTTNLGEKWNCLLCWALGFIQ